MQLIVPQLDGTLILEAQFSELGDGRGAGALELGDDFDERRVMVGKGFDF